MKFTIRAPLQQEHARTEEEVMYPAAVLVGRHVRLRLAQRARHEAVA